jgi:hypothetical protein
VYSAKPTAGASEESLPKLGEPGFSSKTDKLILRSRPVESQTSVILRGGATKHLLLEGEREQIPCCALHRAGCAQNDEGTFVSIGGPKTCDLRAGYLISLLV